MGPESGDRAKLQAHEEEDPSGYPPASIHQI